MSADLGFVHRGFPATRDRRSRRCCCSTAPAATRATCSASGRCCCRARTSSRHAATSRERHAALLPTAGRGRVRHRGSDRPRPTSWPISSARRRRSTASTPSNVIAVGYSNGANIASSMMLLRPGVLAGGILLRPMVPLEPDSPPDLSGTPVYLGAGRMDPIVPVDNVTRLAELLRRLRRQRHPHLAADRPRPDPRGCPVAREWLEHSLRCAMTRLRTAGRFHSSRA